jgi:hypothetical protein
MSLPANVQAQERMQRYLECLARLNLTPPAEVEAQQRAHEANLNEFQSQRPSGINRTTYAADFRDTASQEIRSSFYTRQNTHISGNMAPRNRTQPAPNPTSFPEPGPALAPAPAPASIPPSVPSHSHHTPPTTDIGDSASQANRTRRQASPLDFD